MIQYCTGYILVGAARGAEGLGNFALTSGQG